MGRPVFVPLTDEILYEHPEIISGPLLPYSAGRPCHHWLSVELNPVDDVPVTSTATPLKKISVYRQWLAALRLPLLQSLAR
jgi:hypothetical protein